jgi:6-phosphogluconolactonase
MSAPDLRPHPTLGALAQAAGEHVITLLQQAPSDRPLSLALAGGSTPAPLYHYLQAQQDRLPWDRLHLFWGDERYVPHEAPASNVRLVRQNLLDGLEVPPSHIHPIPTSGTTPEADAAAYEATLRDFFGEADATFDLTLLGMGGDGHTASLFPSSPVLDEESRWVCPVEAPDYMTPRQRLTLTLPCLNNSRHVLFLVSGINKHKALRAVLLPATDGPLPAARVVGRASTTWFVDTEALGELDVFSPTS